MEIDPVHERETLLKRLVVRSQSKLPCSVLLDEGPLDDPARPFEVFDLFFALPASSQSRIDPKTADGAELINALVEGAAGLIVNRFKELLPGFEGPIKTIGISAEIDWAFDDEVFEAEGMLGDLWDETAIPARLTFYARFVAPVDQIAGRCRTAPLPKLPGPSRPGPWARESEEEEELRDPPIEWFQP
jgi:hypothetical protein